jgi:ribonuclease J
MLEKKLNIMGKAAPVREKKQDQFLSGSVIQQDTEAKAAVAEKSTVQRRTTGQYQRRSQAKKSLPVQNNNQVNRQALTPQNNSAPVQAQTSDAGSKQPAKRLPIQNNNKPKRISAGQQSSNTVAQVPAQKPAEPAPSVAQTGFIQQSPVKHNQQRGRPRGRKNQMPLNAVKPSVKVYFLGGINEIGKNFTVYECQNDMIIIDCGLSFPDNDMLGIDVVIPDFTFVEKNISKIRGIFITHAHEDHIGALPYLLKKINVPVYGTPLTLGLINGKLEEHGLRGMVKLETRNAGDTVQAGCFNVEFIHVNHSISDSVAFALHTPAGVIIHTGDFKIDCTPTEGKMIDLHRFAELGKEGVLALLSDSTNAERPGYTPTEQKVNESLINLFAKAEKKRIIVATFASSISRVQQIINCAIKYKRKVALSGRSMLNVMSIAKELGYLHIPDGLLVELSMIKEYTDDQLVLITTGSQGEPMSALSRMAFSEHRQVEVGPNDFIIISARPIPGNEKTIGNVVDELLKRGCEVIYESMYEVHVSGHACQEELKLMQAITRPKYFIPVHGEQKHLRKNAGLAMMLGIPKENIFIGDNGKSLELNENYMKEGPQVQAGEIMVDGLGVGDVGNIVMRDRKHLGEDGLIITVCAIDSATRDIVSGPEIVSRGFVYVRENEEIIEKAKLIVYSAVESCTREGVYEWGAIKNRISENLSKYIFEKTRRNPMILPIIMDV